jgi:hypothetical protein
MGRRYFKPLIRNENLYGIIYYNGIRVVKFATSKHTVWNKHFQITALKINMDFY